MQEGSTHLARVRDDVELLDLASDRVGHGGRVGLLDEALDLLVVPVRVLISSIRRWRGQ